MLGQELTLESEIPGLNDLNDLNDLVIQEGGGGGPPRIYRPQ